MSKYVLFLLGLMCVTKAQKAFADLSSDINEFEESKNVILLSARTEERQLLNKFFNVGIQEFSEGEKEKLTEILNKIQIQLESPQPMMSI